MKFSLFYLDDKFSAPAVAWLIRHFKIRYGEVLQRFNRNNIQTAVTNMTKQRMF